MLSLAALSVSFPTQTAEAYSIPGPIYKIANQPAVYIQHNNKMHAIPSPNFFNDLGYQWNDLHTVTTLPDPVGSPVQLVRVAGQSPVYWYHNGELD